MTEVFQQTLLQSPLHETHLLLGARMVGRDGWAVPASYKNVSLEYDAVRQDGAGLIDKSSRGRILVSGTEAVQFLNGLITNDMKTLVENRWMPAAFPNVQGRLIASVRVIHLGTEGTGKNASPTFLIDTEAVTHAAVLKIVERFTLAGDFRVSDIRNQTAMISVQGTKAVDVIHATLGEDAASLANGEVVRAQGGSNPDASETQPSLFDEPAVIRVSNAGLRSFDIVVSREQANVLWSSLQNAGAQPVGHEAFETLRIEAGIPRFGIDMDETNVVTETGLDEAVSYTKGCYIGQEIIARIKYRGHVAKRLAGLRFEAKVPVETGAAIKSIDGKEVGRITSVADSPTLGSTIALGYLKFDYLTPGTELKVVAADDEATAQVAELPFVRIENAPR